MSDNSQTRDNQRKSEHRTNPRYRLSAPPEVEIWHGDNGGPIQASLGNLSRGGCYVETNCVFPLETELTVTLKKDGDSIKALARVVRAVPHNGLALAFTSMEVEDFRILKSWLSIFVATTWVAANRKKSQRVAMQIDVRVSGYNGEGGQFTEDTYTLMISPLGCSVVLRTPVRRGQSLVLFHAQTNRRAECMVANREARGTEWQIGLAFIVPNQPFWPIDFPPVEWSSHHPDAKRSGT
jgi:PilZ domain-containing protein